MINSFYKIRLLFFLVTFVLSNIYVNSLYSQYSIGFEHLTTENGLSQSDVNCIFQDKEGFLWFGTHDGLNKYDGYRFTVFTPNQLNSNSIGSNLIWNIVDDKLGNLWIGTTGSGLDYFDKTTEIFRHFRHEVGNENSLVNNHITTIYKDASERLWVGTPKGLDMLDLEKSLDSVQFHHYKIDQGKNLSLDNVAIYAIFEDSRKQVWVGGSRGMSKLTKDQNGEIYFPVVNDMLGLASNLHVRAISEDKFGRLIIGTTGGVFMWSPYENNAKTRRLRAGMINNIEVHNDKIWAGTNNGLLSFSNMYNEKVPIFLNKYVHDPKNPDNSLSKNSIKSLFVDRSGIVWSGSNGGGINKFDPERKHFKHVKKGINEGSLNNSTIRSMFEDSNGNLWIGTGGGGLNMLAKEDGDNFSAFKYFDAIDKPYVISEIKVGNRKKIIFGGESTPGLYELDITNGNTIRNNEIKGIREILGSVFSFIQDSNGNIWIGTYNGGINRWMYDDALGDYKKDILSENLNQRLSLPNNIIRDIFEDSKGNIWFGTGNGLAKLTPDEISKKNPKFITYKNIKNDSTSISHNYILNVFEDSSGVIWVGTFGGGLNKFIPSSTDHKESFIKYSNKNGLPNNVIKGILEDDHKNLWLSTNKGISKFNPENESFKNYDVNDGLQNNEFSELACVKRSSGEMLFGGVNGFTAFFPDEIRDNEINGETVLTGFSIFNEPITIGEEVNGRILLDKSINKIDQIDLKYSENSFSVEFAALHYAASRKNNYAYKLEGFNDNWAYTSSDNRLATYTNLEPGLYTLKVKASNNDGAWDNTPAELKINVIPPFWRTKAANAFYVLLFFAAMMAFRRFTIIRSTKKHQLELEHIENEKHEEINRLKLEFFTNISHEFRTPLTLIKGPLEYLQKKGDTISKKEVKDQYQLMHKNIDYLLRLVNQLLDFRKMDKGKMKLMVGESDIVAFLKEVGEPFQFLSLKKNVQFLIQSSEKSIKSWFDTDALEKIVNNLLSNAFKFTPENGKVVLEVFDGKDFIIPEGLDLDFDKEDSIVIQVSDSGPGIPEHRIKHIFERFYTEVGKKNMSMKGTGIGLSFTKNLVKLHQGKIGVISNPSFGTTFYVCLPKDRSAFESIDGISFTDAKEGATFINQVNAESYAIGVMDDIVDEGLSRSRSKLPVLLIVDDNPDIRSFIKRGLGDKYYVYEAENGEKGFELAKKNIPNIIITDLMMPIMDGIEFCDKLKTTQETSHIPVVMLTAKTSKEWEIEGLRTGADSYIRKPFDMELLELKLANILKHRGELRKRFNRDTTLQPNEVTVTSADETFLQKAIEIVEKHMMNSDFSVELLVKEMSLSRSNLYLKIKELTGLSSSEFIRNIRLKRAVQLLEKSDLSVKEIMYMTGFNTASYFSKCFKKQFGVIPSKYIRQNNVEEDSEGETKESE